MSSTTLTTGLALALAACSADRAPAPAADAGDGASIDAGPLTATATPAYLARTASLDFDRILPDDATIELGPGITVGPRTTVGARTRVEVAIAPDATLGPRAAIVSSDHDRTVLDGVLDVDPSLSATVAGGAPARGGLVDLAVASLVPDRPLGLWPFQLGDGLALAPDAPETSDHGLFLVAPAAPLGPRALAWQTGANPPEYATGPGALTIVDRAPRPLLAGDTAIGDLGPYETGWYQRVIEQSMIVSIHAETAYEPAIALYRNGSPRRLEARTFTDAALDLDVPFAVPAVLDLIGYDRDPALGSRGYTFHVELMPAPVYAPIGGANVDEAHAYEVDDCRDRCLIAGTLAPGETRVFAVPPRAILGHYPQWTFGLDAEPAVEVRVGPSGQPTRILTDGNLLRGRSRIADGPTDRPFYVRVSSTATTAQRFQLSARRDGVE